MIRASIVKRLWLRELKELARDQRAILLTVMVPLLTFPLAFIAPGLLMAGQKQKTPVIQLTAGCPAGLGEALGGFARVERIEGFTEEVATQRLRKREAAVLLDCSGSASALELTAWFDPSKQQSVAASRLVTEALHRERIALTRTALETHGLSGALAEPLRWSMQKVDPGAGMLSFLLPFLLLVALTSAGFHHAVDTLAGEKERGTLQTLLSAPISAGEIAVAKYLAILVSSLLATAATLLAMVLSVAVADGAGLPMGVPELTVTHRLLAGAAALALAALLVAVLLNVAVMARTVKEGQTLMTPVLMVALVPGFLLMLPNLELGAGTALIPVLNVSLLLRDCLRGEASVGLGIFTLVASAGWAALALAITAKIFQSEQVLISGERPWRDVFTLRRPAEDRLTPHKAMIGGIVAALAYVIASAVLGASLPLSAALVVAQLGFFAAPSVWLAWRNGCSVQDALRLRLPTGSEMLRCVGLLALLPAFQWGLDAVMTWALPESTASFDAIVKDTFGRLRAEVGLWGTFAVLALTPAIAEELCFRGTMLHGLSRSRSRWLPLIGTAAVFGLVHLLPVQVLTAGLMGLMLAYVTLRSGSILPAMLLHLVNNGLGVIALERGAHPVPWGASLGLALLGGCTWIALALRERRMPVSPLPQAGAPAG